MAVKPKLALIPSGYKASKVYSVLPSDGVGDFDFSRSGQATRVNEDGLIETVDSNIPRLNYPMIDGVVSGCPSLLLEPSRTNLLQYSEDFTQSEWSRNRVALPVLDTISPYGSISAYTVVNNDTGTCIMFDNEIGSSTNDSTFSVFVKYKDLQYISLRIDTPSDIALFDIINGVIIDSEATITPKIENYGNGWFRCSITHDSLTSADNAVIMWNETGVLNSNAMTSTNVGYYLFGAQYEVGSYPTSYIPTQGSTVTREAETASKSGLSSYIGQTEGVIYWEGVINGTENNFANIITGERNTNTSFSILHRKNPSEFKCSVFDGSEKGQCAGGSVVLGQNYKIAYAYKSGDFALFVNGILVDTSLDTWTPPSTIDEIFIGDDITYFGFKESNTHKEIKFYNTRLSNQELQQLTS